MTGLLSRLLYAATSQPNYIHKHGNEMQYNMLVLQETNYTMVCATKALGYFATNVDPATIEQRRN